MLLFYNNIKAQNKGEADKDSIVNKDARPAEMGDFKLLAQRVYEAFLIYTTGSSITYRGAITPPIYDATHEEEGGRLLPISYEMLKEPLENIKSIDVLHLDPKVRFLYGTIGAPCIIKVRLKDNE